MQKINSANAHLAAHYFATWSPEPAAKLPPASDVTEPEDELLRASLPSNLVAGSPKSGNHFWLIGLVLIAALSIWVWKSVSISRRISPNGNATIPNTAASTPRVRSPLVEAKKGLFLWDFRKPSISSKLPDDTVRLLRGAVEPITGHGDDLIFEGPISGRFFTDDLPKVQHVYTATLVWDTVENRSHAEGNRVFAVIVTGDRAEAIELEGGGTIVKALRRSDRVADLLVTAPDWSGFGEMYHSLKLFTVAEHRAVQLSDAGVVDASDCAGSNPKGEVADRVFYDMDAFAAITVTKKEHWLRECDSDGPFRLVSKEIKSAEDVLLALPAKTPPITLNQQVVVPAARQQDQTGLPRRIGGSVSAPQLVHSVEPEFSAEAHAAKKGGKVLVNLWVEPDGSPSHVRVLRGAGTGLDEKAVEAVKLYKFKPAMENGKPVLVEVNIEVSFEVF